MAVRILHCHSTFSLGGKEARAVRLMNAFGDAAEHSVLSGMAGQLSARDAIEPGIRVAFPDDAPSLSGRAALSRLFRLSRYMRGFDLILTYNWGSFDAVMARHLFARSPDFPPLVHHEDGFNEDEAVRQKPARVLYRRAALPAARMLVVPSRNLERIALGVWRQPRPRVAYVPNGVDTGSFAPPAPDAIPGFARREGEVVVGTLAGLRAVKNLPRLVRAFAAAARAVPDAPARLVIAGRGPEEDAIRAEAEREGLGDRLVMPGFLAHPHLYVGLFDIFALSSDSEQFPISLVEAMAAGLPAASTAVGDVAEIVAEPNRPFLAAPADEAALASALTRLIADPTLRARIGAANRAKVAAEYSKDTMVATYRAIYTGAMERR